MYKFTSLIVLAVVLFAVGCTEKSTNYYYNQSKVSSLSGTVMPADSGIVTVSGNVVLTTVIRSDGFFTIDSVPPGLYTVTIEPLNYSKRVLRNVVISKSSDYLLQGVVLSSYPYPIYRTTPTDGATDVNTYSVIFIYADERLNFEDLSTQTTFDPPLEGTWIEASGKSGSVEGEAAYRFSSRSSSGSISPVSSGSGYDMQVGTTYQINIPGAVRTLTGVTLGSDIRFSFTTQPLTVMVRVYYDGIGNTVPITNPRLVIEFPTCVDKDSINSAARFTPALAGLWLPAENYYVERNCIGTNKYNYFSFYPTGPLTPATLYRLVISDQVFLADRVRLSRPDTTTFWTESHGVVHTYPENSATNVASSCTLLVEFDMAMDTISVRDAFELRQYGGEVVSGVTAWRGDRIMSFAPDAALISGTLYRFTIARTAKSMSGIYLMSDYASYFQVE